MENLERILGQRRTELAKELRRRPGLAGDRAERFVVEAALDLIESYRWQAEDLDAENLTAPHNVQNLLRAMRGSGIATRLGISQEAAWDGLRTFVPLALRILERSGGTLRGEEGEPRSGTEGTTTLLGLADDEAGRPGPRRSWRSGWRGPAPIAWPPARQGMLFPGRRSPCEPPAA